MVMITLYVRQQKGHRCKNSLLDSVGEGEGWMIERIALKHEVSIYICEIVQVRCMRQGAQGWCTG